MCAHLACVCTGFPTQEVLCLPNTFPTQFQVSRPCRPRIGYVLTLEQFPAPELTRLSGAKEVLRVLL